MDGCGRGAVVVRFRPCAAPRRSSAPSSSTATRGPARLADREFEIVGEAADGREGIEAYETLRPRLVLMAARLPRLSGLEATRRICSRWPAACVVVLGAPGSREGIVAALQAGAAGYLRRDLDREDLLAGLRLALRGGTPLSARRTPVSPALAQARTPERQPDADLSPRERDLLVWLAHGLTNHQIGTRMHVSEGSVKQYLTRIGAKLGVTNRTQILIRAIQLHLVDPHDVPALGADESA